jgi:uncharacterized membrane protein
MRPLRATMLAAAFLAGCGGLFVSAANAQEPGYFRVSGVAANDVLNIRAEPGGSSDILAELSPGAGPVEVLEVRGSGASAWGRVHAADSDGWVSMRFLVPMEVATIPNTLIPEGLYCGGTEPFWGMSIRSAGGLALDTPDGEEPPLAIDKALTAVGRMHRFFITASGGGKRLTAAIGRYEQCSDGMSDRDYSWRIDLLVEDPAHPDGIYSMEGCCRLPVA